MIVAGSASPLLLSSAGGYNLTNSLRFRSSASAYLNRTPSVASNRKTWTWSAWVKLGEIAASNGTIFSAGTSSGESTRFYLRYTGSQFQTGYGSFNLDTTVAVYRDPSAYYHVVLAVDTTQATASNRLKIYVNGVQQAVTTSVNFTLNVDTAVNNNVVHNISREAAISTGYFDGYLTEVNFIDGQALTPSSFGQTSATTGVWIPKKYTGTYGTNGFYLPFTNTTSTSTLGTDFSGNSNTWTVNNISLTSGSTYDSMTDVPTLTSATTANYCVWNPLDNANGEVTVINGNLEATRTSSTSDWAGSRGTMFVSSGKYYFEMMSGMPSAGFYSMGVANAALDLTGDPKSSSNAWMCYLYDGNKYNGSGSSYGSGAGATTDVFQCALDLNNGKIWWGKNGTWFASGDPAAGTNAAFTNLSGQTLTTCAGVYGTSSSGGAKLNCGQQPFAYTPPTGFVALNTFNLPTPTIGATASTTANKYFNANLYTGNGTTNAITNVGFQPDFVWVKSRSDAYFHGLYDAVRGAGSTKGLYSNDTVAEGTYSAFQNLVSFDSNGFTLGATSNTNNINANTSTFVGWNWKANGAGSTNTAGSITSTVSANTTAGFSIVTYTGTGSNATVGHGLGVAPSMIIVKRRDAGGSGWSVYFTTLPAGYVLSLQSSSGQTNSSGRFTTTLPTSTVFSIGTDSDLNASGGTYVAYCFAQVAGYSAFGSYTGNGSSDGTFVHLGFRPKFLLIKASSTSDNWSINDSSRDVYNAWNARLYPDLSNAENAGGAGDFLSNGFKLRSSSQNSSGVTYIYMAFAETPLKFSNAR